MKIERCETCKWFNPDGRKETRSGKCNYYPPTPDTEFGIGYRPDTEVTSFCSKWSNK